MTPKNDELMPKEIWVSTDGIYMYPSTGKREHGSQRYIRADIAAQGEHEGWRDISSAPRDGRVVDLFVSDYSYPENGTKKYRLTNMRSKTGSISGWINECGTDMPTRVVATHYRFIPAPPVIGE